MLYIVKGASHKMSTCTDLLSTSYSTKQTPTQHGKSIPASLF